MRISLITLFQLTSMLSIGLWLILSPSILTIVPAVFLLSFFGSLKRKTALRGMLIGLSFPAAFLVWFWIHSLSDMAAAAPGGRPPDDVVLEVFVMPAFLAIFIFAPVCAAIGGAAGALNEWIGTLQAAAVDRSEDVPEGVKTFDNSQAD